MPVTKISVAVFFISVLAAAGFVMDLTHEFLF
jgi:hypothetical protein